MLSKEFAEKYSIMTLPEVKAELEPYYKAFKKILIEGRG